MSSGAKGGWRPSSATPFVFLVFLGLCHGSRPAASAVLPQDSALEKFASEDPYTKGDPALLAKVGYVSLGPFHWAGDHTSTDLHQTIGDVSIIFIESAHFRLASTLETYRPLGDPIEKKLFEREIAELKKKLPKVKLGSSLDPWLRAHLFAQRLEQTYAAFLRDFDLVDPALPAKASPEPAPELGPCFGQASKFTVLLTQNQSAYGRYVKRYLGIDDSYSYRFNFPDGYFYGANFEALIADERQHEIVFLTALNAGLVTNFVDAFRQNNQAAPTWFKLGLAHLYARRTDERWNLWNAGGNSNPNTDKKWIWEPRVHALVRNEACISWREMMRWTREADAKASDHMVAWSRLDFLMTDRKKDLRALLYAFTEPLQASPEERVQLLEQRQEAAFQSLWSETPEALDEAWRKWVRKRYPKD